MVVFFLSKLLKNDKCFYFGENNRIYDLTILLEDSCSDRRQQRVKVVVRLIRIRVHRVRKKQFGLLEGMGGAVAGGRGLGLGVK